MTCFTVETPSRLSAHRIFSRWQASVARMGRSGMRVALNPPSPRISLRSSGLLLPDLLRFSSSPVKRGGGTMRSMVEGARRRSDIKASAHCNSMTTAPQQAGGLHLIMQSDGVPVIAVGPGEPAILDEDAGEIDRILQRLGHCAGFFLHRGEVPHAAHSVGEVELQQIVASVARMECNGMRVRSQTSLFGADVDRLSQKNGANRPGNTGLCSVSLRGMGAEHWNVRCSSAVYPVHAITRKSLGDMTRKLSVTESHRFAQLRGTVSRRKPSVASANWLHVA